MILMTDVDKEKNYHSLPTEQPFLNSVPSSYFPYAHIYLYKTIGTNLYSAFFLYILFSIFLCNFHNYHFHHKNYNPITENKSPLITILMTLPACFL